MKRVLSLIAFVQALSATTALACSGIIPPVCANCEVTVEMQVQKGKYCGKRALALAVVSVTDGRVVEQARYGTAEVARGPGFRYLSNRVGSDTFVIGFGGLDRFNKPVWARYRVNVRIID